MSLSPPSQPVRQQQQWEVRKKKKKTTREPHSNRPELKKKALHRSTLSLATLQRIGCFYTNEKQKQFLLSTFDLFWHAHLQRDERSAAAKSFYSGVLVERNVVPSVVNEFKLTLTQSCQDGAEQPRDMHHVSSCPQVIRSFYRLQWSWNNRKISIHMEIFV